MSEEEKSVHTFKDDVASKGGELDDHGVVFDAPENKEEKQNDEAEPAEMKTPEEQAGQMRDTQDSILTNKDDVFDVSGAFSGSGESGSIITDKKQKKRGFGSAVVGAITEWTQKAKKKAEHTSLFKEEKNSPKVAPAKSRKDTILKASENTAQAPRDDHQVVIEKIRTLDTDAKRVTGKPYLIKEKSETETPKWTHTKDEKAPAPTSARLKKKKLTPGSGFSSIAPEVTERTQDLPARKKKAGTENKKIEPEKESETKKEHLVAREKKQPLTPIPRRRSTPSPSRKEKAKEKKEKQKKKFNWWFLFQGLDRIRGSKDAEQTESSAQVEPSVETSEKTAQSAALNAPVAPTQQPFHSATPQGRIVEDTKAETEPEPETMTAPGEPEPDTAPEQKTGTVETEMKAKKEAAEMSPEQKTASVPVSHNRYKLVLSVVIFLAVAAGAGATYYFYGESFTFDRPSIPTQTSAPVTSFFPVDTYIDVPLSGNRQQFLQQVTDAMRNTDSNVTHIYPTVRETNGESDARVPATTEQIFSVIDPRAPSGFVRALEENMMIGSINASGQKPFIILRSHNFDVAFAGMLDWEANMSADLAPLFGSPVSRTYNENARTLDRAFDAGFQDTVVANNGARVLYDVTHTQRLIYTFVDRETIVITTNSQALERLLTAIR